MTKEEKKRTKPEWVVRKISFNLSDGHNKMLEELITISQKANHRAGISTVLEDAIEELYKNRASVYTV